MESQLNNRWNSFLPVPFVNQCAGIFLGIINIIFPGLGLALATCVQQGKINTYFLIIALCQFLLAFIVIGWIWAVINGVYIILFVLSPDYNTKKDEYELKCKEELSKKQIGVDVVNEDPLQQIV